MIGPIAIAVLGGCLNALRWLLWLAAALIIALVVAMWWRGEASGNPVSLAMLAIVMALAGAACGWLSNYLANAPR